MAIAHLIGRRLPCIIKNKSDLGVRLQFGAAAALDPVFIIEQVDTGERKTVRLIWTDGRDVGVRVERFYGDRSSGPGVEAD